METRRLLTTDVAPIVEFDNPDVETPGGFSELTRLDDSIAIETNAAELVPGDAVTAWWVVFNNPEFCEGSCTGADLRTPEVEGALFYADGAIVAEDGAATFTASLQEGDVSGVDPARMDFPGSAIGLTDASKAEVHFVMRTHGAAFSEGDPMLTEQLTTFGGGCNTECTNVQGVGFSPVDSTVSNSPIHLFTDSTVDIAGTDAKLTRYSDSIAIRADTAELVPGDAVTAWWVVFNNPEFCEGSCTGADLRTPEVEGALFYADGAIVAEDGTATFTASLQEGDVSGVDPARMDFPGSAIGLTDASKAEVHFVMRTHGAAFSEGDPLLTEQLTTFGGGCNTECTNVQGVGFSPVDSDSPNPIVSGDVDQDGVVDFEDFLILSAHFGQEDATRSEGDLDGNGVVDFRDFVILSSNFEPQPVAAAHAKALFDTVEDNWWD